MKCLAVVLYCSLWHTQPGLRSTSSELQDLTAELSNPKLFNMLPKCKIWIKGKTKILEPFYHIKSHRNDRPWTLCWMRWNKHTYIAFCNRVYTQVRSQQDAGSMAADNIAAASCVVLACACDTFVEFFNRTEGQMKQWLQTNQHKAAKRQARKLCTDTVRLIFSVSFYYKRKYLCSIIMLNYSNNISTRWRYFVCSCGNSNGLKDDYIRLAVVKPSHLCSTTYYDSYCSHLISPWD